MKDEVKTRSDRDRRITVNRALICALSALSFSSFILHPSSLALAEPTQQDVLRSIGDSVGDTVDPGKMLAIGVVVVGLVLVVALVNMRRKRQLTPRALNHPGKLLKEVAREISLKPAEVKQLRSLADNQELSSPLMLLLCPSLLDKAVKQNAERVDRNVIRSIARRITTR
jgi:hypothetical protein